MRGAGLKKTPIPEHSEEGSILMDVAQPPSDVELTSWDASVPVTSPNSSNDSFADAVASSTETTTTPDWTMVYKHLQNIERQQCSMMSMLQVMASSPFSSMVLNVHSNRFLQLSQW
jgi:flavin-binding protein dodecin